MNYTKKISLGVLTTFVFAGLCSHVYAAAIGNATYGIYSNTYEGVMYDSDTVEGAYMGQYNGLQLIDDTTYYVEGGHALKVVCPAGKTYGGCWTQFGVSAQTPTDMSAYSGGYLDFSIRTSTDIKIGIESSGAQPTVVLSSLGSGYMDGNWHSVSIPLSSFTGINLSAITVPAGFHYFGDSSASKRTFWIDNVVWRKSTTGSLSATIKNISNNASTNSISWDSANPDTAGWKCANQYLELKMTYYHSGWGIQIYTDNKATNANPRYTGSDDPAGLIGASTTSLKIPMCWRVVDVSTTTLTIKQGITGNAARLWSNELGNSYPCFLWMKDKNSSDFSDSLDYITVWDEKRGIQYAESTFGSAVSPNYVYFGAKISDAMAPETYKTGKLTVELYYE